MSMRFVTIVGGLLMLTAGGSAREPLPGMPPVLDARDIYSETRPGKLSPVVRDFPRRVYVPNSGSNTVDVIDPETYKIVDHFRVGKQPQHVTPSYDLKTLWVLNDLNNTLTKIDPATGKQVSINSARGDKTTVVDLRSTKFIPLGGDKKLGIFVELFNAFNTANFGANYSGNASSVNFRQPTGFIPGIGYPRQVQIGSRLLF